MNDRRALTSCVVEETPTGRVSEMDVALSVGEMHGAPGFLLEPWVRVTEGAEWELSAGVQITRDEDDGA